MLLKPLHLLFVTLHGYNLIWIVVWSWPSIAMSGSWAPNSHDLRALECGSDGSLELVCIVLWEPRAHVSYASHSWLQQVCMLGLGCQDVHFLCGPQGFLCALVYLCWALDILLHGIVWHYHMWHCTSWGVFWVRFIPSLITVILQGVFWVWFISSFIFVLPTFGGMYSSMGGLSPVFSLFSYYACWALWLTLFWTSFQVWELMSWLGPFGVSILGGCVYRAIPTKKIFEVWVVIKGSDNVFVVFGLIDVLLCKEMPLKMCFYI